MSAPATRPAPGVWERESPALALPPGRGCPLPPRLRNRGKALLNQQFWLWGQDVRGGENLLRRYGFDRVRPPPGIQGSNVYILPDGTLALWGFGLLARWPASREIFLGRFRIDPRIPPRELDPAQVWQPAAIAPTASPVGAEAWHEALTATIVTMRWMAAYETWVGDIAGSDYRRACLGRWSAAACAASVIAESWLGLAADCEACLPESPLTPR